MEPGDRIRERRIKLGLTQEEVALKVGYTDRSAIAQLERGRNVRMPVLTKLAVILQTTPEYLAYGIGTEDYVTPETFSPLMCSMAREGTLLTPKQQERLYQMFRVFVDAIHDAEPKSKSPKSDAT